MLNINNIRVENIRKILLNHFHNATSELQFNNNFELLVSVVLSAQCTDKRVNIITPNLFKVFPNPEIMAKSDLSEIENLIKSCNIYRNKAKYLKKLSQQLLDNFDGKIPLNAQDLQTLSGVGQKTANVVLIESSGANLMAVDTHVFRVSHRLELTDGKTPKAVEKDLSNIFQTDLGYLHQAFVLFGRYFCKAQNPNCSDCILKNECHQNYE